jgi:hypothetical protein
MKSALILFLISMTYFNSYAQESKDTTSKVPKAKWTMQSQNDMEHLRPLEDVISQALVLLQNQQYDKVYKILAAPKAIAEGENQGKTEDRISKIKEQSQEFIKALTADLDSPGPSKFVMGKPPEDSEEVVFFTSTFDIYFRIGQHWYLNVW